MAVDDAATVAEGGSVRIDVLANDTDFDGDLLSVYVVEATSHGAVQVNADWYGGVICTMTVRRSATSSAIASTMARPIVGWRRWLLWWGRSTMRPRPRAGADQVVAEEAAVQLSGSGTDPEGEVLTYRWSQVSGLTMVLSEATVATPTFTAPTQLVADATLVFELVVTDASGAVSTPDAVTITVEAGGNDAPVFDALSYAFELAENEDGSQTPIVLGRVSASDPEGAGGHLRADRRCVSVCRGRD